MAMQTEIIPKPRYSPTEYAVMRATLMLLGWSKEQDMRWHPPGEKVFMMRFGTRVVGNGLGLAEAYFKVKLNEQSGTNPDDRGDEGQAVPTASLTP